ncbi:ribonuclease H-like domain, reverse transcriptase, RNA-dependent DNA polymerase [Tanacetum coccineum]
MKRSDGNNTNNVNIAGIEVNAASSNTSIELLNDPNMPELEGIVYSDDYEDVWCVADMNNLNTFMPVSPIPTTRIHKDHLVEQNIRDLNSAPQTRRMTKNLEEHEEPNKVYKNKNDERGIVIKNKERLVAQGYTQEEGINYDQVFDPIARIEAIVYFLAYASFKDFMVYQMDVKSAFLYGKIEEKSMFVNHQDLKIQTSLIDTPMETQKAMLKDEDGEEVDVHLYRSVIGSLMYLTSSRLDIIKELELMLLGINLLLLGKVNAARHNLLLLVFWSTAKVKTVNREVPLQALVDGKKIVVTEASLMVKNLDSSVKFLMYPRFVQVFLNNQLEGMATHNKIYIATSHSKKIFANMRRKGKDFSGRETPLFSNKRFKLEKKYGEVDETQGRYNDDLMFDTCVLNNEEVFAGLDMIEKEVSTTNPITTAGEVVTAANVEVSTASLTAATITNVELTLAQTLAELKSARPKIKGVVMQEPSESITTTTTTIPSKDNGKGIMVEEPLKMKKKDQISFNEQEAIRLHAEFDEEVRLAREKDEANVALIKECNDIQVKIEADQLLAKRLQAREQEELTIEERAKLFQQLLEKRRKFFAAKRAEEKRNKPPTKAHQRSIMTTYLKNMAGWKPKDVKNKSFANQKVDDDQETTELQGMMEVIPDKEEVAVDVIPLATKPPSIVDWKIIKEGKIGFYQIIRADGNSKRPEEGYKRVLWGDLKTIFEHNIKDTVWRNLLGNKVLIWKLFDSCGVHFVRFQDMHIFMLVGKKYPLTPTTITEMLNKKLQTDHCNEMCYQILKLMTKQLKKQ